MMKRLTCTLAALALLMATSIPARAEFRGTLQRNLPWMVEIASGSTEPTELVVYYLGRDLEVVELVTLPPGATVGTNIPKPGRGVRRVIVEVDQALGGAFSVRVTQGNTQYADYFATTRVGEALRWVFHVE